MLMANSKCPYYLISPVKHRPMSLSSILQNQFSPRHRNLVRVACPLTPVLIFVLSIVHECVHDHVHDPCPFPFLFLYLDRDHDRYLFLDLDVDLTMILNWNKIIVDCSRFEAKWKMLFNTFGVCRSTLGMTTTSAL